MEYQSVLKRLEEQKNTQHWVSKLYRYSGLIHAVEFFSMSLTFDQVTDAAFDFTNEMLFPAVSALFCKEGPGFALKKSRGSGCPIKIIPPNEKLNKLASLHGGLLYDRNSKKKYFDDPVLEGFDVSVVIPLIIEFELYGFIFISEKAEGKHTEDDMLILETLMRLFNNSLETASQWEKLQNANRELDEKIFNLFAINQSSKALLSELNTETLNFLSVDVFSELTQSSSSGFILYDEKSERYKLKAYKQFIDTHIRPEINLCINNDAVVDPSRIIIELAKKEDVDYFNMLFNEGVAGVFELNPVYIVLLIKNSKILGMVSLGQTVMGLPYKHGMFELIESLASSTYTALSNARLFDEVNQQKEILRRKLENLISLNHLMKNINSSTKVDILAELTLKTLDISFGAEKAAFVLYDKSKNIFEIRRTTGFINSEKKFPVTQKWKRVLEGDTIFEGRGDKLEEFLGGTLADDIGGNSGILVVPVCIERLELDIIGAVIVFKFRNSAINEEEKVLTLETIANHIAPVVSNLMIIEEQERFLLPNYIEIFKNDLRCEIQEAVKLSLPLVVIQVAREEVRVFEECRQLDKIRAAYQKVYPFSLGNIFIILNEEKNNLKESMEAEMMELLENSNFSIKIFTLGKEFNTFPEFFKHF